MLQKFGLVLSARLRMKLLLVVLPFVAGLASVLGEKVSLSLLVLLLSQLRHFSAYPDCIKNPSIPQCSRMKNRRAGQLGHLG